MCFLRDGLGEKFLEENPEWQEKVVLLQTAVPTRTDVPEYQKLTKQVHEIVGQINGRFGTLTTVPIQHLVEFPENHSSTNLQLPSSVPDNTLTHSFGLQHFQHQQWFNIVND
ncbi:alpha,alpha-trehalose-phosphate synthase [UDP-forming] 1-like [Mangifera indica]|uniref:alpha,alpha-trehalose-phosphate synthase [UDP-forming] 1-like n=1 Tax=Mangifera indica TaxID=29780 RepID=UPI001CFB8BE8|nr:alpha,alpha-trehalose-phosphate synthase [UDP-forming] 1-like [Mangifera indica]